MTFGCFDRDAIDRQGATRRSFHNLFLEAAACTLADTTTVLKQPQSEWPFQHLDKRHTYMFELCHPKVQISPHHMLRQCSSTSQKCIIAMTGLCQCIAKVAPHHGGADAICVPSICRKCLHYSIYNSDANDCVQSCIRTMHGSKVALLQTSCLSA